ncbi:hypothetical protein PFICI_02972 [Pestalotiopsis fici W106-1]|uniref:Heterokaryon incompatibility domain-containing protein n=1 Tax=Pestalotiopsis fici (strain W106-1 / CGMCC3.15140) TaxID=1229662 RepID=W3XHN0_PESFW|nr:uncharacterized protein PFICI_02972 [Pestalotiopsis fici W106-1]ETS84947.1 hypothetical protein PFICI_02972 [Pestalotiopsis fici W106-1]
MRLLQLGEGDELLLTRDLINHTLPYAILSHTWGQGDDDEVLFHDIINKTGKHKPGYQKILFCGRQARRDGLDYFWVDTCCIDKTSSAELSEAINSMYRWYQNAQRCYVYLSDVLPSSGPSEKDLSHWKPSFHQSRWFNRGWTLQELIAPRHVSFFSSDGGWLGDKQSLEQEIHKITSIPVPALQGVSLSTFDTEERISWSVHRTTTRAEDKAYSLLGILGIHMPLIYGEGEESFDRLRAALSSQTFGKSQATQTTGLDSQADLRKLLLEDQSIYSHFSQRFLLENFDIAGPYQRRALSTGTQFHPEDNGIWTFSKADLVFIKTKNTTNGKVEVHRSTFDSRFQDKISIESCFNIEDNGTWLMQDYTGDGTPDLVYIKTKNTPDGNVEIHAASGDTGYKQLHHRRTNMRTEDDGTWTMDSNGDLVYIKTRNTGSGKIEVHVLSKASNYQTFSVHQATTFNIENDGVWCIQRSPWLSNGSEQATGSAPSRYNDLYYVKTNNTGTGTVEVHMATGCSDWSQHVIHVGSNFLLEDDGFWLMAYITQQGADQQHPDLVYIKTRNTGSGSVEVHVNRY